MKTAWIVAAIIVAAIIVAAAISRATYKAEEVFPVAPTVQPPPTFSEPSYGSYEEADCWSSGGTWVASAGICHGGFP